MPLVTVKQPDGTYAKITLEEFMRRQKNGAPATAPVSPSPLAPLQVSEPPIVTPPPAPEKKLAEPVVPESVRRDQSIPQVQPMVAERREIQKPLPPPIKDAKAFLSDFSTGIPSLPSVQGVSAAPAGDVDKILGRLSFSVPEEYQARLRNIIELRVKELRKDDQTKAIAARSYDEGGLQLTPAQCEELLSLCAVREQVIVPPPQNMATATPFNSFKHASPTAPNTNKAQFPIPAEQPYSRSVPVEPAFGERSKHNRPTVTDVTYKPMSVGPIEEIRAMTLTDFRRLSPVPRDAALRLEQKFTNLKGESIMLFIDGLDNWRQSSLYQEYTDRLLYAILHRSSLDSVLRKTKSISSEELSALIAMEKRLTF